MPMALPFTFDDLTLQSYGKLLEGLQHAGYAFSSGWTLDTGDREGGTVALRHDLDFSIDAGVTIATVESKCGVSSTFFVQLRSGLYNALAPTAIRSLERIAELGHGIGLHVDLSNYSVDDRGSGVERELRLLTTYLPMARTDIVSLHRPGVECVGSDNIGLPPGVLHTYHSAFVRRLAYFSDSGGTWRFGHPLDSPAFRERRPLHLLTHPVWWVLPGQDRQHKVQAFGRSVMQGAFAALETTTLSFVVEEEATDHG